MQIDLLLYILSDSDIKVIASRLSFIPCHTYSSVNKRRSWCCVSCSFLVEESNSAPAIAGATSQGSGAALNAGSRFLAIPGNPGKPLFCACFSTHTHLHTLASRINP